MTTIFADIPYRLRRSRRSKRVRILVSSAGVEVVLPLRYAARKIEPFLQEKRDWIEAHWRRFQAMPVLETPSLLPDSPLLYQGSELTLHIQTRPQRMASCHLEHQRLTLALPSTLSPSHHGRAIRHTLGQWLTTQLYQGIDAIIEAFSPQLTHRPKTVTVRAYKTRWGSCSSTGHITIHFALIFAPPEVLTYVVIHELAHLRHMSHCKQFWGYVAQLLPDYKPRRAWLRKHGAIMGYWGE